VRHFPHLRNRSWRRFDRTRKDSLDRIDDDRAGRQTLDLVDDVFKVCLGKDEDVLCFDCQTFTAQLDLSF
jgi:hypothetical protein